MRKTVTILFCDLVGSTALGERTDPELLRELMSSYHATLRVILERHGGTVEKFVGDAAMAVFGIPTVHEDDAERAVRAAVEMREAVVELGLSVRMGISTGEVASGTGETLVTGDAVNLAARFEQAAEPGEILIGAQTERLVGGLVRAETLTPLRLKGKAEAVPAFRLIEVLPDVPAFTAPIDAPFVGRVEELAALRAASAQAVAERATSALYDRRTSRDRQISDRARVSGGRAGPGPDCDRPLPSLRRGDHLLAARGDCPAGWRRPATRRDR